MQATPTTTQVTLISYTLSTSSHQAIHAYPTETLVMQEAPKPIPRRADHRVLLAATIAIPMAVAEVAAHHLGEGDALVPAAGDDPIMNRLLICEEHHPPVAEFTVCTRTRHQVAMNAAPSHLHRAANMIEN